METSRTFSNVLEHFKKKRKNFVANLIVPGKISPVEDYRVKIDGKIPLF
jgi:hypothetical protein